MTGSTIDWVYSCVRPNGGHAEHSVNNTDTGGEQISETVSNKVNTPTHAGIRRNGQTPFARFVVDLLYDLLHNKSHSNSHAASTQILE